MCSNAPVGRTLNTERFIMVGLQYTRQNERLDTFNRNTYGNSTPKN